MTPDAPPHPVRTVIVTYLRPDELTTTLARLADQTLRAERTVVVDNDPAGSAEAVAPAHWSTIPGVAPGSVGVASR